MTWADLRMGVMSIQGWLDVSVGWEERAKISRNQAVVISPA